MLEAGEFREVYGLQTVQVPETYPSRRVDHPKQAFFHPDGSHYEVARLVSEALVRRQPVLLGTTSITESEHMARLIAAYVLRWAQPLMCHAGRLAPSTQDACSRVRMSLPWTSHGAQTCLERASSVHTRTPPCTIVMRQRMPRLMQIWVSGLCH